MCIATLETGETESIIPAETRQERADRARRPPASVRQLLLAHDLARLVERPSSARLTGCHSDVMQDLASHDRALSADEVRAIESLAG